MQNDPVKNVSLGGLVGFGRQADGVKPVDAADGGVFTAEVKKFMAAAEAAATAKAPATGRNADAAGKAKNAEAAPAQSGPDAALDAIDLEELFLRAKLAAAADKGGDSADGEDIPSEIDALPQADKLRMGNDLLSRALKQIAAILGLPDEGDADMTFEFDPANIEQFAAIMAYLDLTIKMANDRIDVSANAESANMAMAAFGMESPIADIAPEQNAAELSEFAAALRTEKFRIDMAFRLIGVGGLIAEKMAENSSAAGTATGIPQAVNPADLSMSVADTVSAFSNLIKEELAGSSDRVRQIARGQAEMTGLERAAVELGTVKSEILKAALNKSNRASADAFAAAKFAAYAKTDGGAAVKNDSGANAAANENIRARNDAGINTAGADNAGGKPAVNAAGINTVDVKTGVNTAVNTNTNADAGVEAGVNTAGAAGVKAEADTGVNTNINTANLTNRHEQKDVNISINTSVDADAGAEVKAAVNTAKAGVDVITAVNTTVNAAAAGGGAEVGAAGVKGDADTAVNTNINTTNLTNRHEQKDVNAGVNTTVNASANADGEAGVDTAEAGGDVNTAVNTTVNTASLTNRHEQKDVNIGINTTVNANADADAEVDAGADTAKAGGGVDTAVNTNVNTADRADRREQKNADTGVNTTVNTDADADVKADVNTAKAGGDVNTRVNTNINTANRTNRHEQKDVNIGINTTVNANADAADGRTSAAAGTDDAADAGGRVQKRADAGLPISASESAGSRRRSSVESANRMASKSAERAAGARPPSAGGSAEIPVSVMALAHGRKAAKADGGDVKKAEPQASPAKNALADGETAELPVSVMEASGKKHAAKKAHAAAAKAEAKAAAKAAAASTGAAAPKAESAAADKAADEAFVAKLRQAVGADRPIKGAGGKSAGDSGRPAAPRSKDAASAGAAAPSSQANNIESSADIDAGDGGDAGAGGAGAAGSAGSRAAAARRADKAEAPQAAQEDRFEIIRQLSEKMNNAVRAGANEARMVLRPEALGEVRMSIRVQGDVVFARMQVESKQVKAIVESNLQSLKDSLHRQNLEFGAVDVEVGADSEGGKSPRELWEEMADRAEGRGFRPGVGADSGGPPADGSSDGFVSLGSDTGRRFGENTFEYFA